MKNRALKGLLLVLLLGVCSGIVYWARLPSSEATSTSPPKKASPLVIVPQSTVGDVMELSLSERAAFMRGFFSALVAYRVGDYTCAVPLFFEKGWEDQIERSLQFLKEAKASRAMDSAKYAPDPITGDPKALPPEFYMEQPMGESLSSVTLECYNQRIR